MKLSKIATKKLKIEKNTVKKKNKRNYFAKKSC